MQEKMHEKTVALVQAHAKGWDGAKDYSLYDVDGRPIVQHTIERLLATPGIEPSQCHITVPDDEVNEVFRSIADTTGTRLFRGSLNNVADRLLAAADQAGATRILHVMGQHMFLIPELLGRLLTTQEANDFDLVQAPINFETRFTGIVVKVEALRRAMNEIQMLPEDQRLRLLVRPLSYIFNNDDRYRVSVIPPEELPRHSDTELKKFRELARQMYCDERSSLDRESAFQPGNYNEQRYLFALELLGETDEVIDAACGNGYGSEMIAKRCKRVVGVDLDADTIEAACIHAASISNLRFEQGDACALNEPDQSFTAFISLETIEHVPDVDAFCREVKRVLKPGGQFICSTPQNLFGAIPINPWHLREYNVEEFRQILQRHFTNVEIRGAVNGVLTDGEVGNNMIAIARRPADQRRKFSPSAGARFGNSAPS